MTRIRAFAFVAAFAEIAFAPRDHVVAPPDLPRPPRDGDRFALRLRPVDGAVAETETVAAGGGA